MNSRVFLCGLLALGLASSVSAQTVDSIQPTTGSIGETITINGSGFGEKKGKVVLQGSGDSKPVKLKVLTWSEDGTTITAQFKKGAAGNYDLVVQPKDKTLLPATAETMFTVALPQFSSLVVDGLPAEGSTPVAEPNFIVRVLGEHFGSKKGKLDIGGIKAKILSWISNPSGEDEITFVMPKKLANGLWPLHFLNKIGEETEANAIQQTNSLAKIGKAGIKLTVDGTAVKLKYSGGLQAGGTTAVTGSDGKTKPNKSFVLIVPFDWANDVPGVTYDGSFFFGGNLCFYNESFITSFPPPFESWAVTDNAFSVTINASSNTQVAGFFAGPMSILVGDGPAVVNVEGSFILDLPED